MFTFTTKYLQIILY